MEKTALFALVALSSIACSTAPSKSTQTPVTVTASAVTNAGQTPSQPIQRRGFSPSPVYAQLFDLGRSWKVEVARRMSYYDVKPIEEKSAYETTCRVDAAKTFDWGLVSTITCENLLDDGAPQPIGAIWVATKDGLFRMSEAPTAPPSPKDASLILAADPVPGEIVKSLPEEPDFGSRRNTTTDGSTWCVEDISWGGDSSWTSICLEPGFGIRSAGWGWDGGSTHENSAVLSSTR